MANNDFVIIDGIIDDILERDNVEKADGRARGVCFEQLAISELLKTYDLSIEQLNSGIVDGKDDGGIDGFYIFINGIYLSDTKNFYWPRENGKLEIYIITCKHHNTYELAPLESLDATLSELLDFSIPATQLKRSYNACILQKRELLYYAYRRLAPQNITPIINIMYISRGDSKQVAENILKASDKITDICCSAFENSKASFNFWGTSELVRQIRKKRNEPIEIKVQRSFQLGCNYVVLVSLNDYINAVTDNERKLKRYLFDENVRSFLGENRTNSDILNTLRDKSSPDFWLLNNGITMLTSNATIFDNVLYIEDLRIVNGLQTTFTLFNYFQEIDNDDLSRNILIKVIKPDNPDISQAVIRATNNQSAIPLYALHANDTIQMNIEDVLKRAGFFYERRQNYYTELGFPKEKIISPLYLASGYAALILKIPHRASTLKSKFMNNKEVCEKVFSESTDLNLWPIIAAILRKTDAVSERYRGSVRISSEKYLRSVRYVISLVGVARILGKMSFSEKDLLKFDIQSYTDEMIGEIAEHLIEYINSSDITVAQMKQRNNANCYLQKAATDFLLPDFSSVRFREDIMQEKNRNDNYIHLSEDFLMLVKNELPPQPWPIGVHRTVATKLKSQSKKVSVAISILVNRGIVYRQKDGIVYDNNGKIIAIDKTRQRSVTEDNGLL